MIHAFYNEGSYNITVEGKRIDILAETIALVHSIYESIKDNDEDLAEMLRKFMTEHLEVIFMTDEELGKEVGKLTDEVKENAETLKTLEEINDILDNLINALEKARGKDDED